MTDLVRRDPVLIGEISGGPPSTNLISIITVVADRLCLYCDHPASQHTDNPPGPELAEVCARLGRTMEPACKLCACSASRLEAAGWTPPGGCAGQC